MLRSVVYSGIEFLEISVHTSDHILADIWQNEDDITVSYTLPWKSYVNFRYSQTNKQYELFSHYNLNYAD